MLLLPTNVVVNVYRTFSAGSPYPVQGTTAAVANLAGHLKHHLNNGKFGRGNYLHWTHLLYLPPGTDIRSGYDSQLNAFGSAAADTVTIQDFPIPGFCTAFFVVLVQRAYRGTRGDCLKVYLDRMQPQQGSCFSAGGVTRPCCPNALPLTLHLSVANVSGCACGDGFTMPLTYNPITTLWEGSGNFCSGSTLTLGYSCGTSSCADAGFSATLDGHAITPTSPDAGCSCSPLMTVFSSVVLPGAAGNCPGATVKFTFTT
jgi:hypothetical protein